MIKKRLEIPEMIHNKHAWVHEALDEDHLLLPEGQIISKLISGQNTQGSWCYSDIPDEWLQDVYFCDECGGEMKQGAKDASDLRSNTPNDQCYACFAKDMDHLEEPREVTAEEVTAEEWHKTAKLPVTFGSIVHGYGYDSIEKSYNAGIKEGHRREQRLHEPKQTFEEYCNQRKHGFAITAPEAWKACEKNRGYDDE